MTYQDMICTESKMQSSYVACTIQCNVIPTHDIYDIYGCGMNHRFNIHPQIVSKGPVIFWGGCTVIHNILYTVYIIYLYTSTCKWRHRYKYNHIDTSSAVFRFYMAASQNSPTHQPWPIIYIYRYIVYQRIFTHDVNHLQMKIVIYGLKV